MKDSRIAEFTPIQQHARELQVIACRRVKPTAAAEKSNWFERLAWRLQEATILLAVMDCYDTRLFLCRDIEKCVCHAERLKNMLTKVFLQSLAADFLDQLAEPVGTDSIFPSRSWIKQERCLEEAIVSLTQTRHSPSGRVVVQFVEFLW